MPCPFAVAGYACDKKEICRNRICDRCINTCHIPFRSANTKKHKCISNTINQHEKESRCKQPNTRVDCCTQSSDGEEDDVECRCHSTTSTSKTCCSLYSTTKKTTSRSDFSTNCKMSDMQTCLMPSNEGYGNFTAKSKPRGCLSFACESRDCASQTQDPKNSTCPKTKCYKKPSSRNMSIYQNYLQTAAYKCQVPIENTKYPANSDRLGTYCKKEASRYSNPHISRAQTKTECNEDCYSKHLLVDIQTKINDINSQCDWAMKQNADFVQHLWRLCNAKSLQCDWANLAKQDPFNGSYTKTNCRKRSLSDGPLAIHGMDFKCENIDTDSATMTETSCPNQSEPCNKSKAEESPCEAPCNRVKSTSVASGQEAATLPGGTSEYVEMPQYDMNYCQANLPNSMCRPLILCSAPFNFNANMLPNICQNASATQPNKQSDEKTDSSDEPIKNKKKKVPGMDNYSHEENPSTESMDTDVPSKKKTASLKSTKKKKKSSGKNQDSEIKKSPKSSKVSSKKKSGSNKTGTGKSKKKSTKSSQSGKNKNTKKDDKKSTGSNISKVTQPSKKSKRPTPGVTLTVGRNGKKK